MVDVTFVFLIIATVFFGIRSLLETYSVKELATRFGMLIMFSFIVLVSIDFSVIQKDPLHSNNQGGVSPASLWSKDKLPEGFGPLGISLPPWNPFGVAQAPITQEQYQQLMLMMAANSNNKIPPLNGEVGVNGYGYKMPEAPPPRPTKPPPRVEPPSPIVVQTNGIQEKTMEKFVSLLEHQIDRLDQQEKAQKKALSNSFKDNVKLSSEIYHLSKDAKERTNRVSQMERDLKKITKATSGELSEMKKAQIASMSQPLFQDSSVKSFKNQPATYSNGNSNDQNSAAYLAEISRKIDEIASGKISKGSNRGGEGGGGSSKALRNAQLEVERLRAERAMLLSSKASAETNLEQLQLQLTTPRGEERAKGAFAVLANIDPFSVKAALAVCNMLKHHQTKYDVLIITPTRMDNKLAESVKRCGCYPTTLGEAPYPPKFEPMRPSFRVCWHKLRLFLLTQYQAIVALDSDIVVLSNIDELVDKVIAEPGDANFWMAAHDETPLCEKCGAEVSGAPNAGVFGLRPNRMIYEKLIARSKKASPWYGERWSYSEQELLSVYFLVEREVHNSRMVWLDNAYNSFACKFACDDKDGSSFPTPAILHFVGVDKPYTLFVDATRRSKIVNTLTKVDVSHAFIAQHIQSHYQTWFEHYMTAMNRAMPHTLPQLKWHDDSKKRWVAFLHVPKTGGSALISSFMEALFGEYWFHLDCTFFPPNSKEAKRDAPPLCATYGDWIPPKKRKASQKDRCNAIGCMGHLPYENMKTALGPDLNKVTDFVTVLRHPVKLFISEYYYIRDQLSKPSPSLQFVGDTKLLKLMMGGMTLAEYVDYMSKIVKHGQSGLGSAFNRQTYFLTTASVDEMRYKSDEVFLQAAIKLNKMDFVGITEDMSSSVALLQCILGVPDVHVPKKNVGSYQPVEDADVLVRIEELLALDMRVYEFAVGLFHQRKKALHFMRQYYSHC